MVVGIISLGTSILLAILFGSDSDWAWITTMLMFILALPSIVVWHILNEAIRLSNFEVTYREHITAFAVASIVVIWFPFFRMADLLDSIELPILVCLFLLLAVLNSYHYVTLCRRFLPNNG